MSSNLKLVGEVEVPDQSPEQPKAEARTERPSAPSSAAFRATVAVLAEIRRILSVRAGAMLAMTGAMLLTAAAMYQGTLLALGIAASFDVLVFAPVAFIAWGKRGE